MKRLVTLGALLALTACHEPGSFVVPSDGNSEPAIKTRTITDVMTDLDDWFDGQQFHE